MGSVCYVVITPVRDEEEYLPATIASMCAQTVKPWRWLLINDGSRDQTGQIIDSAAAGHPWMRAMHREDRGFRKAGGGVVDTFYTGYDTVADDRWEYVVKFDGDLAFGPDYFEKLFREFEANPKLGIAGGLCCKMAGNALVPEYSGEPPFHVRGPTKLYRRECFQAIGGLIRAPGWDTVDQIKANMLGWQTRTFPEIRIHHQRPTGGAYGAWNDAVKNGLSDYITGYHPAFMACKCLLRMARRPFGPDGPALWWGFMKGYLTGAARVGDPAMIRYLRGQQWRALTFRTSLWS